jgi:hypothetical protein
MLTGSLRTGRIAAVGYFGLESSGKLHNGIRETFPQLMTCTNQIIDVSIPSYTQYHIISVILSIVFESCKFLGAEVSRGSVIAIIASVKKISCPATQIQGSLAPSQPFPRSRKPRTASPQLSSWSKRISATIHTRYPDSILRYVSTFISSSSIPSRPLSPSQAQRTQSA